MRCANKHATSELISAHGSQGFLHVDKGRLKCVRGHECRHLRKHGGEGDGETDPRLYLCTKYLEFDMLHCIFERRKLILNMRTVKSFHIL